MDACCVASTRDARPQAAARPNPLSKFRGSIMDRRSFPWEGITMLTKRRAVLEMPAEAQDSSAGGAVADGGFWIRFLPCLADTEIIFLALVVLLAPAAVAKEPAPAKP